jgi:biotin-dependent carboxylase-like uncharacterized protein
MPAFLQAVAPTPCVTLQDRGRRGWRRFGVTGAGAMDRTGHALANALVGNRASEVTLEFAYAGGEWLVEAPSCRIAVAGGAFAITVDGTPLAPYTSAVLERGQRLRIGSDRRRVWGYLGVAGGFDLPLAFGSRATHAGTGIGGWKGGVIREGDALPLRADRAPNERERSIPPPAQEDGPFRLILGPQEDYIDGESILLFLDGAYQTTWQQDRMAYRLDGPKLRHAKGFNIISDGVLPGCIQIMGTGLPVVLMRDAGTNGGYPKLGAIIDADLDRFAQTRPGQPVRFTAIDVEDAHVLRRQYLARLHGLQQAFGSLPG